MATQPTYAGYSADELLRLRERIPRHPSLVPFYSAAAVALPALLDRIAGLEALIAFMDARLPLADATCDEPGITFSAACQREMEEARDE